MRSVVAACALVTLASGCSDPVPTTSIVVRALDGSDPFAGASEAVLRSRPVDFTVPVTTDRLVFDSAEPSLAVPFRGTLDRYLTLEIRDVNGALAIGGTPYFDPYETPTVELVVGPPGTCADVPALALGTPREGASAVLLGTLVVVAGGIDAAGPSAAVDVFDLLNLQRVAVPNAPSALGRARVVRLASDRVYMLGETGASYAMIFDPEGGVRFEAVPVHAGAERGGSVVAMPYGGVAVVGGDLGGVVVDDVTWVTPQLSTLPLLLDAMYSGPDRTAGGSGIGLYTMTWNGDMMTQEHTQTGFSKPKRRLFFRDGARHGASMVVNETGARMVVLGGTDDLGAVRTDAFGVEDCPVFCASLPFQWQNARLGATVVNEGIVAGGEPPSDLVEEVYFHVDSVSIDVFGILSQPRAAPAVARMPFGPALVFGGRTSSGITAATDFCFGIER